MDEAFKRQIEQAVNYKFRNSELFAQAFTHSSSVEDRLLSNERLEFLGDAILGLAICEALYEQFPDYLEGDLTKIKSMLVSRRTCARVAKQLGLHDQLRIGKGMQNNRSLLGSLAAGLLEAVVAVIYLDGGFDAACEFVSRAFAPLIETVDRNGTHENYKSVLQQYSQRTFGTTPVYVLLDEKGPDHDKCFESQVLIGDRSFTSAWGTNKKDAEQKAAFNALAELGVVKEAVSAEAAYNSGKLSDTSDEQPGDAPENES